MEEDGVIMVKFKSAESAWACVKKMDSRYYDGRSIAATISTGREKFSKTRRDNEEEEKLRHEEYGKWLDEQEQDGTP